MIHDIEPVCIAEQKFCSRFFHLPEVDDQEQQTGEFPNEEQVYYAVVMAMFICC